MKRLWQQVDQLLRRRELALTGEGLQEMRAGYLALAIVGLAAAYGFFMGWYSLFSRDHMDWRQTAADTFKVPTLFLMTLVICFPSLYVFSAMLGSRLTYRQMLRVMLAIVAVTVTVLSSFGPIAGFFALSTESHPFMVLLNVGFFTVAGLLGVEVLWKALSRLLAPAAEPLNPAVPPPLEPRQPDNADRQVKAVFRIWILIYAVVGCQMGWVLRPFISDPKVEFLWFCGKQGNFFLGVWEAVTKLFPEAMATLLITVDELLRGEQSVAADSQRRLFWTQVRLAVLGGLIYGATMGSFNGLAGEGWKQVVLSATKAPCLFLVTFALCLPSFFVLNAVAGLHHDFPRALNCIGSFQSLAAIVLAALAPITGLMNLSASSYSFIVGWSGLMFLVASACGQRRMMRLYRPLIAANPRHRYLLWIWITLYWFVGIQMAWVLRPFVGWPNSPFQILRPEVWGNAYVHLAELIWRLLR